MNDTLPRKYYTGCSESMNVSSRAHHPISISNSDSARLLGLEVGPGLIGATIAHGADVKEKYRT